MRFAHISDSHLGCRQFGLLEREKDFYEVFNRTIDKIIEEDVDFVIHSGDLFDSNRPSTEALLTFQQALLRLNEAKIPVYAIAGNHDSILRKGSLPPQVLFKDIGLNIISPEHPVHQLGAVLICGVPFATSSQKNALVENYNILSKVADTAVKSILVSHQGISKWMPEDSYEIDLDDLPKNFDYYAMGHLHNFYVEDYGKGKLVYPGSMEINRTSELNDNFKEFGKGFCIVDLSEDIPTVERVTIDLARKFYNEIIAYDKLDERLSVIEEELKTLEVKPIVDITVRGGDFESADVYEKINEKIGGDVLSFRPTFKPDNVLKGEIEIDGDKTLDPKTLLKQTVDKKFAREEVTKLSVDLLETLSEKRMGEAKYISDEFYDEYYYHNDEKDIISESESASSELNANEHKDDTSSQSKSSDFDSVSDNSSSLDDYLNKNLDSKEETLDKEKSKDNQVKTKELSLDNF